MNTEKKTNTFLYDAPLPIKPPPPNDSSVNSLMLLGDMFGLDQYFCVQLFQNNKTQTHLSSRLQPSSNGPLTKWQTSSQCT